MKMQVNVFYDKKYSGGTNRMFFLDIATIMPPIFLVIDMIFNKVKIPFGQIGLNIVHSLMYFGVTLFS